MQVRRVKGRTKRSTASVLGVRVIVMPAPHAFRCARANWVTSHDMSVCYLLSPEVFYSVAYFFAVIVYAYPRSCSISDGRPSISGVRFNPVVVGSYGRARQSCFYQGRGSKNKM